MDRFGIDTILGPDERLGIVVEMCRRGFAERMVLSQDAACYIDWVQPDLFPFLPNWSYLHVLRDVVPGLLERGVTPGAGRHRCSSTTRGGSSSGDARRRCAVGDPAGR